VSLQPTGSPLPLNKPAGYYYTRAVRAGILYRCIYSCVCIFDASVCSELHGGVVASAVASQHEGRGFKSRSGGPSGWSLRVLPVAAWVLRVPPTVESSSGELISKCPAGVNVSVMVVCLCEP